MFPTSPRGEALASANPRQDKSLAMNERPLDGVRVIEVGQLVAGPFSGAMLAYFGADVVKV